MALETIDVQYLFGNLSTMLALSACVAGVAFQTVIKWYDKWQDGQPITFDKKFIGTAITAIVGSVMVAIPLLNASASVLEENIPTYGLIFAWIITASWAYALNNGANGILVKLEEKGATNLLKSGKIDRVIEQKVDREIEQRLAALQAQQLRKEEEEEQPKGSLGGDDVSQPETK